MKLLTMDLLHGFQMKAAKNEHAMNDLMINRFPDFKGLKLVAKTILLTIIISAIPLGSAFRVLPSGTITPHEIKTEFPLFFHELLNEGHLKPSDRVLVIMRDNNANIYDSHILGNNNEIEFVSNTDQQRQSSLPNEYFDLVFTHDLSNDKNLIERTLKVHGIITYAYNVKNNLRKIHWPVNYKVYLRKFVSTAIVILQKTDKSDTNTNTNINSPTKRRLLRVTTTEGKKEILEKLEDVLLEPPRGARSKNYLKRIKYLPDLLGDSLESYPRRIFIDVGPYEKALGWFAKHYPKKNKIFEIYRIKTVAKGLPSDDVAQVGMSEWLRRNVREEEYVVMKAEAEVVEEMAKNRALDLVDELFLECKYEGVKAEKKSSRAYWECLALYGRLRDEGVAVHQWWG